MGGGNNNKKLPPCDYKKIEKIEKSSIYPTKITVSFFYNFQILSYFYSKTWWTI